MPNPAPHRLIPLVLAAVTALFPGSGVAAERLPSERLTIERRAIDDLKAVFATVESVNTIRARARIAGTVAELAVVEGDAVTRGRVLATVRDPKFALQINALDARIQSLQAQVRQAQTDIERVRQLRLTGSASQQRLDDAQTGLDVVLAQLAAQRAERAVVEEQQREGAVTAPVAGRVLKVEVVDGAVVMPGEPVATIATETYVLRLRLPERHARFLKIGDPVLVGARGLGDRTEGAEVLRRGHVRLVYPELTNGQVVADAEVADLGNFFVGERVRVFVATGTRETVVVPAGYLYRRFGLDYARLAEGGEVVVQTGQPVPERPDAPGGIEVLSGLRPGDVLIKPTEG